jgi:hypothetical protein
MAAREHFRHVDGLAHACARPLLGSTEEHGETLRAEGGVDICLTIGISSQTKYMWDEDPEGTERVRQMIANALS